MVKDFTLEKYKELCEAVLGSGYRPVTIRKYFEDRLEKKKGKKLVLLRHDVDRVAENALKMAKLENILGISSTYYFRMVDEVFKPGLIKNIHKLGHEVGYHYEVLDKAKGDHEEAIKIFEKELAEFRKVCEVKTISMHGNPLSSWRNVDIWKKNDLTGYDLLGETYVSIDYAKVAYFTDTGRRWDGTDFAIDDYVDSAATEKVRNTDELIALVKKGKLEKICILCHPNRWGEGTGEWLSELVKQNIKNVGKRVIKKRRARGQ